MRYAYHALDHQDAGTRIVVRWRGSGADVLLLDPVNFTKYREGRHPVHYSAGGKYGRPPAELTVPEDGRWFVVADLHGYAVHAKATVEVLSKEGGEQESQEEELVEVG